MYFHYKNGDRDPARNSFDKYYMPLVEIKEFNALNAFFWSTSKKWTRIVWKFFWNVKKWWYTTGNLLDFSYYQNHCEIIGIDLSRQKNTSTPQQINFRRKLEKDDGATMFFVAEKQHEIILNFSSDSLILQTINNANDSKFVTRKWNIVNDNSNSNYTATNEIIYNTEFLNF